MPRFVARPVIVEAFQFDGTTVGMPDAFRSAVVRHRPDMSVEFMTGDGPRSCKYNDWIVRGPDGQLSIMREATFEAMFAPVVSTLPPEEVPQHAAQSVPTKPRKEKVHG